ncbi:lytic murein transglycosylase [Saccharibacter sp. 17.LH.SD]|uniref:lytic murein transglycosylase n=1 Tax=Saccharibacter sp. 17.LH.SD TaxID=2689393 RepID=UPI00136E8104|nr:lytic murein transglycosylase [Saccharibacter sp. 17.LH.SD]MXV44558.1 lytic murein transglycosylase [Saccharibacter sp. 17.LH.SD]
MKRRYFVAGLAAGAFMAPLGSVCAAPGAQGSYADFCAGIRREAIERGIPAEIVDEALSLTSTPNADVLKRDRHQPEFHMTWAQYRDRVVNAKRCQQGRAIYQNVKQDMHGACQEFGADPSPVMGIWGIESGFGATQGRFSVIDALATLAYDGRRSRFFRDELLKALKILADGNIAPAHMLGSYAGAMGQAQFMPSAYLRFAADGDHDGRKDIWNSQIDIFASIANYLGRSGWQTGESWGEEVVIPLGSGGRFSSLAAQKSKNAPKRTVGEWSALGVSRRDGQAFDDAQRKAKLLQPDGPGGQVFLVYDNFRAIRAYNPSDYYALAVGLLGDAITRDSA